MLLLDNKVKVQANDLVKNSVAAILLGFMLTSTAAHAGFCDRVVKWGGKKDSCVTEYNTCAQTRAVGIEAAKEMYEQATTEEQKKAALRSGLNVHAAYVSCNNGTKRKYPLSFNPNVSNALTNLATETQDILKDLGAVAKRAAERLEQAIIKFAGLIDSTGEEIANALSAAFATLHANLDKLTDEARDRLAEILFDDLYN